MRRLVVNEFLTLDGVMQGPGSPDEDRDGGFEHGGWQAPYFDEAVLANAQKGMAETDAYLFGRRTYQIMAAHWPTAPADDPFGAHLNATRKYVASRTLHQLEWENAELLDGEVAATVADLKAQDGGAICVLGSGELVQTLIAHDLIDEFSLVVCPLVLGSGKRLFRGDDLRHFELAESASTPKGNILATYRPSAASAEAASPEKEQQ